MVDSFQFLKIICEYQQQQTEKKRFKIPKIFKCFPIAHTRKITTKTYSNIKKVTLIKYFMEYQKR